MLCGDVGLESGKGKDAKRQAGRRGRAMSRSTKEDMALSSQGSSMGAPRLCLMWRRRGEKACAKALGCEPGSGEEGGRKEGQARDTSESHSILCVT